MPTADQILSIGTAIALDLIGWIRRRHAESGALPTDAEVLARARAKIAILRAEAADALAEFPEEEPPPS